MYRIILMLYCIRLHCKWPLGPYALINATEALHLPDAVTLSASFDEGGASPVGVKDYVIRYSGR